MSTQSPPVNEVSDFALISQEDSIKALIEQKKEEAKALVTSIIVEIDKQERPTREIQIKIWKYLDLLWTGIANFYWNSTSNQWKPITYDDVRHLSESSDIDPTLLNKTINMLRPYGESIIGVLTTVTPRNKYFPANAEDVDDINTSKAYTKIEEKIAIDNVMKTKIVEMLRELLIGGFFGAYNYSHSDEKYGTVSQPTYRNQRFRISTTLCPECGAELDSSEEEIDDQSSGTEKGLSETINEGLDDENLSQGELRFETEAVPHLIAEELEDQNLELCPNCQAQMSPINEESFDERTVPDGDLIIPKSRQIIEIYGPMELKIPTHASKKEDIIWCILEDEIHEAKMRSQYPDHADKIQPGSHTDLAYDRWARSQYENMGELNQYYVTRRRVWLKPDSYWILGNKEKCELLKTLFPSGLHAVFANNVLLFMEEGVMDDCWTFSRNPIYKRYYGDPLLKAAIPLQESSNDLFQLELETIKYAIPQSFADPVAFDFEKYAQSKAQPGLIYPLKKPASGRLDDVITSTITASLPKEVEVIEAKLEKLYQFILGTFPSVFGGEASGTKTLGEYEQSRGQALQRLNINPQHVIHAAYAEIMGKAVEGYKNNLLEDEAYVTAHGNSFVNVWIKKADLQGRIGEVRPEMSEQFPTSWGQKKATWLELIGLNNEVITQIFFHPENIGMLKEIMSFDDLYVPGDDQRNKQLEEIRTLISTEPIQPPIDQMGQTPIDPVTEQPAQPTSTVPIEPVDDDNIHIQVLSAFICSSVGQALKENNPAAYMNLLLHLQEHQMRLQEVMAQQMAQEAAMNKQNNPQNQDKKLGEANA